MGSKWWEKAGSERNDGIDIKGLKWGDQKGKKAEVKTGPKTHNLKGAAIYAGTETPGPK